MKSDHNISIALLLYFLSLVLILAIFGRPDTKTNSVLEGYYTRCIDNGGEYHVKLTEDGLFEWCEVIE